MRNKKLAGIGSNWVEFSSDGRNLGTVKGLVLLPGDSAPLYVKSP